MGVVEAGFAVLVGGQQGCGLILLTLVFFKVLQQLVCLLPLPRHVARSGDVFRVFRWRNLVVSWIHACITGVWMLICSALYWTEMWKDMIEFRNWPAYGLACFSTGYFIYDTLDIVIAGRIREKWEILVHHVAIISTTAYGIVHVHCLGYHVLAMGIEVNTAFLHFRKLLQVSAVPRTNWALQVNRYLNLATFLFFRFGPLLLLTRAIVTDGPRVPRLFLLQFSVSMITLNIVNLILFYRLVKADVILNWACSPRPFSHHKTDSTAGVCGSLQVSEDFPPLPSIPSRLFRNHAKIGNGHSKEKTT